MRTIFIEKALKNLKRISFTNISVLIMTFLKGGENMMLYEVNVSVLSIFFYSN